MNITITVKHVYGVQTAYPACPTSALLAKLAGTKTLTAEALSIIRKLGFAISIDYPDAGDLLGGLK